MAFSGVYVFGDSLVDGGNALGLARWYDSLPFAALPDGAPTPALGYFNGRFSNGYSFADLIANKTIGAVTEPVFPFGFRDPWLGIPIAPFMGDPPGNNLNFAYGGARVRQGSEAVPDLDGQTDAFKDAVDSQVDPNALIMVTMGGNDVRRLAPAGSDPVAVAAAHASLDASASRMLGELNQLVDLGARNFLISGIPDVGIIPAYDLDGNLLLDPIEQLRAGTATQYSSYLDSLIRTQVVPQLQARGAAVTFAPVADYVDPQGQHVPGIFNLNLPTIAALNGLTAAELSDNLLAYQDLQFFDHVHPTGQLHALAGSTMYAQLTGTPWIEQLPRRTADIDYGLWGNIAGAGVVGAMLIELVRGTTYTFEMLGISSLGTSGYLGDTSLRLVNSMGTVLAADDDSGVGFDARLTFTPATNGTFGLEMDAPGGLTGSYLMQVTIAGRAAAAGNTYRISNPDAVVLEPTGGAGVDTVQASVSYALAYSSEIEVLKAADAKATDPVNLTGNQFDQKIYGNNGRNTISGKGGDDLLWGRGGQDTFVFDTALDGSVDTIKDFRAFFDKIALDDAIFGGVPGALAAEAFRSGPAAIEPDDRILYDPLTRALYFDGDGSGPGAPIHFATLEGYNLNLDASTFVIV